MIAEHNPQDGYPKEIDWSTYKFRCSMLGQLLPGPRGKLGFLQTTQKTALRKIFMKEVWGFKKDFSSKQTEKGNHVESSAIGVVCRKYYDGYPHEKNEERMSNDFVIGTFDLRVAPRVHDIKAAYDLDTFMTASLLRDNEFQVKAYQWITGDTEGQIDKVLVNMPEHMAEKERDQMIWKFGGPDHVDVFSDEYLEAQDELERRLNYDRIPEEKRIKSFRADIDNNFIEFASEHLTVLRAELSKMKL
jgi:hypothetical protein